METLMMMIACIAANGGAVPLMEGRVYALKSHILDLRL
jgi:hypothetical protein